MFKLFKSVSEPLTKAERKNDRRRSARHLKCLFAAYHFLHTSRDGAVIAQIVGCQPIELYRWSHKKSWINAIQYWNSGYNGDGILEGEYFLSVVGDSIVERSLDNAKKQWTAYVTGRENRELRKTLNIFEEMGFTE